MFPPGTDHIQGDRWAIVLAVFTLTTAGAGLAFGRLGEIDSSRASVSMARNWLAAIVDSSDDAVFSKTLDGTILTWNAGAERLYGYTAAEAIGRPVAMLSPPDRGGEIQEILARLRRGETINRLITQRVKKDGTLLDISLVVSPVRDASGRLVGASTIARDIADRVRLLRDEQAARREAERLVGRIARLQRLTAQLSEALTPERIAQVSLRHAVDDLGVGAAAFTYLEEAGSLVLLAATGYSPGITARWQREPGEIRPIAEAMRTGRVVWVASWAEFVARYPEAVVPSEPARLGARVAVPLQAAVGESVTNVVEHAYGATAGTVRIRSHVEDGVLRVSVEDRGRWRPERVGAQGGRGFALIRGLANGVEVDATETGTTVRLAFATAGAPVQPRPAEGPASRDAAAQAGPAPARRAAPRDEAGPALPSTVAASPGAEGRTASHDVAQFETRRVAGIPVVGLNGDLDITAVGRFARVMEHATAEAEDAVILDLSGASYFDSQGIRARLEMRAGLARSRRILMLVVPQASPVRRVIDVSGAGTLFPIFGSVEEAVVRRAELSNTVERGTP